MITLETIQAAYRTIRSFIIRTPVLESEILNTLTGCRVLFKAENLQKTGSFKYRGATYFLSRLSGEERKKGIVSFSSGNHAQAVSAAASKMGISAKIIMPSDAPPIKIKGTKAWGADVILYDRYRESREEIAGQIASQEGRIIVPPFDHPWIMAGQGTAAIEFIEQLGTEGVSLDVLLVPCSGGGLTAGVSTALKALAPSVKIWAVEPEDYNDTQLSFHKGERMSIQPAAKTICDALALTQPGELTFPILLKNLEGVMTASDNTVSDAVNHLWAHLKLVVEPGGAIGLAALLEQSETFRGRNVGIILSGGNADAQVYSRIITEKEALFG